MTLPPDYLERVYAGVLGKIIGVYLGRPFEGWSYESIMEHLGEINYYVHEKLNVPLIVTDDDISGTFTFVRAMQDYGYDPNLTPAQIGHTWMNYLIEEQTILWWGGMGNSTEHTAYLRLKEGIEAPRSGSIELNGKVVAEQIGSQIFIDGWAMIAPGDPERAADFARRAGSVSHDGEAIYGAQVLAAMESQAFVEHDLDVLIDTGVSYIPKDSVIYQMISDIREWHTEIQDWRESRILLDKKYGYDVYGGNCHMIPNHGLMILSLLYGDNDFQKSQMIVNTSGWDTDCNAGNIGCFMGIKNGLAGFATGPDWRGPVADRLYLPTADGGRAISDAVTETIHLVNTGRALQDLEPIAPKGGARFHFDLPGSVQGFIPEDSIETKDAVSVANVKGYSETGSHSLAMNYQRLANGRVARIETATFVPSSDISSYFEKRGYRLLASPTLYAGQTIKARLIADENNNESVSVSIYIKHFNDTDTLQLVSSNSYILQAGDATVIEWEVPYIGDYPIAQVGIQIIGENGASGTVYLDYLTWDGAPNTTFNRPYQRDQSRAARFKKTPVMWKKAWINGLDTRERLTELDFWPETYRLIQNVGRGLFMQGTREWTDYQVTATMTPHMCDAGGLGVRAQGMKRYYAMLVDTEKTQLVVTIEGKDAVLAEVARGWEFGTEYKLSVKVEGNKLSGYINDELVVEANDNANRLTGGGIALIAEVGRIGCEHVEVRPL